MRQPAITVLRCALMEILPVAERGGDAAHAGEKESDQDRQRKQTLPTGRERAQRIRARGADGYRGEGDHYADHKRRGHQQMRDRQLAFRQWPVVSIGMTESDPGNPVPCHDTAPRERISPRRHHRTECWPRSGRKAAQRVYAYGDLMTM